MRGLSRAASRMLHMAGVNVIEPHVILGRVAPYHEPVE
jgi:hypothetical protein